MPSSRPAPLGSRSTPRPSSRCSPSQPNRRSPATAGCSSASSTGIGSLPASRTARRNCSRATAMTTRACFRRLLVQSRRCRSRTASLMARSCASTPQGSRASRACSSAGDCSRRSTSSAPPSSCRRRTMPLIYSLSRASTCAPCSSLGARSSSRRRCRSSDRSASSTTSSARAKRFSPKSPPSGSRESSPKKPTRRTAPAAPTNGSKSRKSPRATSSSSVSPSRAARAADSAHCSSPITSTTRWSTRDASGRASMRTCSPSWGRCWRRSSATRRHVRVRSSAACEPRTCPTRRRRPGSSP